MDFSFLTEASHKAISHQQFFFNLVATAVLTYLLGLFYIRFGTTLSNRRRFARNFMLLALTTMLIINIVQASVALSLGLVGALSIVRFRAAIKEPEELAYLFLNIGIGLGMGANEVVITVLSFSVIIVLLYLQARLVRKERVRAPENMFINISATGITLQQVTQILKRNFENVQLKRMDQVENRLHLSYLIDTEMADNISIAKDELEGLAEDLTFSFVEQRNLMG